MQQFSWANIRKPVYILAPMANITTLPFRYICKSFGADIVYTPMISSNAILYNTEKTLNIAKFLPEERPVIVQLFGYSTEIMSKSAKIVEEKLNPDGIDINMGCPAPKITGNDCGSALLKDFEKALEIVESVRDAYSGQLSVKLRLGWESYDVEKFIAKLENTGINSITIHGRTAKQNYRGESNWDEIYNIADKTNIPIIGNGDIKTFVQAIDKTKSLAGVMIGRSALERPWIFEEIQKNARVEKTREEISEMVLKQVDLFVDYLGEKLAVKEMRKFLAWYLKGWPNSKSIREKALYVETQNDIDSVLMLFSENIE